MSRLQQFFLNRRECLLQPQQHIPYFLHSAHKPKGLQC